MTDDEVLTLATNVFATVFTREKHLDGDERLKEAYRAARRTEGTKRPENAGVRAAIEMRERDPIVPNDISDERARKIIAAIALSHDTTSADVRSSSRAAEAVAAREEAACELTRAGFGQRAVARLLGRRRHADVPVWIENHERRVAKDSSPAESRQTNQKEVRHASRVRESGRREGDSAGAERHNEANQPNQKLMAQKLPLWPRHIQASETRVLEATMGRSARETADVGEEPARHVQRGPAPGSVPARAPQAKVAHGR